MSESTIPGSPPSQNDPADNPFGVQSQLSAEDLQEALNDLREQTREQERTVYESVFREFFMKSFTGQDSLKRHVCAWAATVNGFNRWATVVDDKTGAALFRVPPILNTATFDPKAPADPNLPTISNVIDMAIMNTSNRLLQRNSEIRDRTLGYIVQRVNNSINPEFEEAWRKIYAFYGVPFEGRAAGDEQAPAPTDTSAADDKFVERDVD